MNNEKCKPGAHPAETEVIMTELVLPNDTNPLGNLLGGRLLHWIDIVGALAATRHSRKPVATVSVEGVDFRHPIFEGDMVTLSAKVIWTGRTSIAVRVQVKKEDLLSGAVVPTNTALLTFVAMDKDGKPCQVPPILPATEEEMHLYNHAQAEYESRKGGKNES